MDDIKKQIFKQRIEEILFHIWDPIGVVGFGPAARDEYDSYADRVWRMALEGKSKAKISDHLTEIRVERIEFDPRKEHDDEVAELILGWQEFLEER